MDRCVRFSVQLLHSILRTYYIYQQMTKRYVVPILVSLVLFLFGNIASGEQISAQAIENNADQVDIGVYPNPNHGDFKVRIPASKESHEIQIDVVNLLGSVIQNRTIDKENSELSKTLSLNLGTPGVYFVRVSIGNKVFSKRVVVE